MPSTLRRRIVKTQQSQVPETLECTREHAHSKVLIEPTWRNQHGITISAAILDLCLRKTQADKSPDYRDVIVFEKFRFQNVFRPHSNEKLRFQERFGKAQFSADNFSGLDGTEGLTVEIKLRFQIPPAQCERGLRISCKLIKISWIVQVANFYISCKN